jgi:hypothetical protein
MRTRGGAVSGRQTADSRLYCPPPPPESGGGFGEKSTGLRPRTGLKRKYRRPAPAGRDEELERKARFPALAPEMRPYFLKNLHTVTLLKKNRGLSFFLFFTSFLSFFFYRPLSTQGVAWYSHFIGIKTLYLVSIFL